MIWQINSMWQNPSSRVNSIDAKKLSIQLGEINNHAWKPGDELPGTFNFHDKSMQTTGVVFTGAHLNQKHRFPHQGKSLRSSRYLFFFSFDYVHTLNLSIHVRCTQSHAIQGPLYREVPYYPNCVASSESLLCKSKCF